MYRTLLDRNYGNLCNNLKKRVTRWSQLTRSPTLCFQKETKLRGRKKFEWNAQLSSSLCNFPSLWVCVMQVDGESLSVHKQHCGVTNWRGADYYLRLACSISMRRVWVGAPPVQCFWYRWSSPRLATACTSGSRFSSFTNLSWKQNIYTHQGQ